MKRDLTVVIPAFNECNRIGRSLDSIRDYAAKTTGRVEVIVVDDGSADDTAELVRQYPPGDLHLRVFVNDTNRGKGYSVRRGMLEATGDLLLMFDADASSPISELPKLTAAIDDGADVAIGSRAMPQSVLDPKPGLLRRLMTWIFSFFRRMIMLRRIRDTQCGFKLFTRDAAREIFALAHDDGFAFDCEVLALAEKLGYGVAEVGIMWHNDANSTIRPIRDSRRMLVALLRIRRRLARLNPAPPIATRNPD